MSEESRSVESRLPPEQPELDHGDRAQPDLGCRQPRALRGPADDPAGDFLQRAGPQQCARQDEHRRDGDRRRVGEGSYQYGPRKFSRGSVIFGGLGPGKINTQLGSNVLA